MLEDVDKGKLVGYAAAALLVVAIALRLHSHGSSPPAVELSAPARAAPALASAAPSSSATRELYVDVAGAVRRPGVYKLPAGSRVALAVDRAGGLARRAERVGVNLAAPLHDGEQVIVPVRGAAAPSAASAATGGGGGGGPGPSGPISLSQATEAQLEEIDGIGPALAGRIIQYREAHGGFRSVDELRQVQGIGDKRFANLSKALRP